MKLTTPIDHEAIAAFAEDRVNLDSEAVKAGRRRVKNLRERLEKKIEEDPEFALVKMLHSGSVRKGTALATTSDMDVAVYVRSEAAPGDPELIHWLEERLREAYPQLRLDQFQPEDHCVSLLFETGMKVDAVPVLYEGAEDNFGYLITKDTGDRVLTSVSRHIEFIRGRKDDYPGDFAQVVRLVKWWVRQRRRANEHFRLKSFLVELVCAHLADEGLVDFSDYPRALEDVFNYVVRSELRERIAFTDNYPASRLPGPTADPIEIFDPVNGKNNVAARYDDAQRAAIIDAADEAAAAIAEAQFADSKGRAVERWQIVLGPSFKG